MAAKDLFKNRNRDERETNEQGPLKPFNQDLGRRKTNMSEPAVPEMHIVNPGDSLTSIAQTYLGDSDRWPEVFEANKEQIQDPLVLRTGQELIIPK